MHNELQFNKLNLINNALTLIDNDAPFISNLANLSKLIFDSIPSVSWCGFYLSDETCEYLYLGPFQGPIACTTIKYGKGVCGNSALRKEVQLVPNVHEYPGHIACSSLTNSEVVIPLLKDNICVGVLDLDSCEYNNFTKEDVEILKEVCELIVKLMK